MLQLPCARVFEQEAKTARESQYDHIREDPTVIPNERYTYLRTSPWRMPKRHLPLNFIRDTVHPIQNMTS